MDQLETLIPATEYAAWRGITVEAAAQERYRGTGPAFVRAGRRIYYRRSDIEAWLDENTRTITGATA